MKNLNRKGFTLIELLAVIVILAIILVVTVPNIINSISDARLSSIHNLAKSVANTYDTAFAQDLVATDANKLLGDIPSRVLTNTWTCIGDSKMTSTTGQKKALKEILGLSDNDLILTGTAPSIAGISITTTELNSLSDTGTCSAIKIYNGSAQVLLVAKQGGKFYVAQKQTFALSTDAAGTQKAAAAAA